jgi:hypothetical protein
VNNHQAVERASGCQCGSHRALPKNISAHPDGYLVRLERGDVKYQAFVAGHDAGALLKALWLRERFYRVCGLPQRRTARHSRSNTDVVGITETTHWNHGHEYRKFNVHTGGCNKGFYFGRRRSRADAFNLALNHRAKFLGVKPETLLPQWP